VRTSVAARVGLAYLFATNAINGLWSLLFPRSFYDSYPGFGLELVEKLPAYNEHLINDYATFSLGFAALFGIALLRPDPFVARAAAIAFLVYAVPHFMFHMAHLAPYDTAEKIAAVLLVGSFVAVPLLTLLATKVRAASRLGHSTSKEPLT